MALKRETIQKLRAIKKAILAEPEKYNQRTWADPNTCGTPCCIAGWADRLEVSEATFLEHADLGRDDFDFAGRGQKLLSLTDDQAERLFDGYMPLPYDKDYYLAKLMDNHKGMAKAGARRIEHFIRTGGAE